MMSLSFQTAIQKNEAKLSFFVQFESEVTYRVMPHCSLITSGFHNGK